jgi:hypothetical protein
VSNVNWRVFVCRSELALNDDLFGLNPCSFGQNYSFDGVEVVAEIVKRVSVRLGMWQEL